MSPHPAGSLAPAAAGIVLVIFPIFFMLGQHESFAPAAAGIVLVIFPIFFMLGQHESFAPAAAGCALTSVLHASDPQHASAEALHDELAVAALIFFDLLQPTTAKPRTAITVRVKRYFIVIFSNNRCVLDYTSPGGVTVSTSLYSLLRRETTEYL